MASAAVGTDIYKGDVLVLGYRETPTDAYTFLAAVCIQSVMNL
jgi:hypothetical protein